MSNRRLPLVCLFVGPSLRPDELRAAVESIRAEVRILPPAQQCDVLKLIADEPDVIGIVDGLFFQVPALMHREILLAIEHGTRVLGASSLGALRAAELDRYGMEGVGQIYRLYRRGALDGDDEVAVLHGPAETGFCPLGEALVTIRHNVARARRLGMVSPATAAAIVAGARQLYFAARTWDQVLATARGSAPDDELAALRRFVECEAIDLKREDALELVRTVAARLDGSDAWPPRPSSQAVRTSHFERYRREYVGRPVDGQHVPDELVAAFAKLLDPASPRIYRRVLERCLAVEEARHRGLIPAAPDVLLARFGRAQRWRSTVAEDRWRRRHCMLRDELVAALQDRDLEARVLQLHRAADPADRGGTRRRIAEDVTARVGMPTNAGALLMHPGVPWSAPLIRELKLRGAFQAWLDRAGRVLRHNALFFERHPSLELPRLRRGLVETSFAQRWGVERTALKSATAERGFARYGQFVEVASQVYLHERLTDPSLSREGIDPRDWFQPESDPAS